MISSNDIIKIIEDYKATGKIGGLPVFIFENPSKTDYLDLIKQVKRNTGHAPEHMRFIADAKSQKVYVSDAYAITHDHMRQILSGSYSNLNWEESPWVFDGIATISSTGDVKMDIWDKYFALEYVLVDYRGQKREKEYSNWLQKVFSYNWSWVDKYVPNCSAAINSYKEKYLKIINSKDPRKDYQPTQREFI